MSGSSDRTVREIDAMAKAIRAEGKATKEQYDWFTKSYRQIQVTEGKRQRQDGVADASRL